MKLMSVVRKVGTIEMIVERSFLFGYFKPLQIYQRTVADFNGGGWNVQWRRDGARRNSRAIKGPFAEKLERVFKEYVEGDASRRTRLSIGPYDFV